jgi:hypothetical protein
MRLKHTWNKALRRASWTDNGWRCKRCKVSGGFPWAVFHFHEGPRFSLPPTERKEL